MRRHVKTALTLGALALIASPALAQRPGGGFGGGMMMGGGAMLLSNKSVQEELKADPSQVEKLNALATETMGKMRDKMQGLEPQDRMGEKGQAIRREVNDEMHKSLAKILKDDQVKRFDQVELQLRYAQAFSDPKVQEKLKLTADQKAKIRAANEEANAQRREIMQGGAQGDREAMMKKMTDLNKETMTKAAAVLNDDQKATWKEMVGAPFTGYRPEPPRRPNN